MLTDRFAPVALFSYRRKVHLSGALASLRACPEFSASPIFVFSDGPRDEKSKPEVDEVRAFLYATRSENMTIIEAEENLGLAASVIAGVTRLCNEFGRVIVIEDDLLLAPCALQWFNVALDAYRDEAMIWQVAGHQMPVPKLANRREGVFLRHISSWGWATWKRAWDHFDAEAHGWQRLQSDEALAREFDMNGAYPFSEMLIDQMAGRIDSWAIRWRWSMFREGGIALFPPRSLVRNLGHDASATHTRHRLIKQLMPGKLLRRLYGVQQKLEQGSCPVLPRDVQVNLEYQQAYSEAMRSGRRLDNRFRAVVLGS